MPLRILPLSALSLLAPLALPSAAPARPDDFLGTDAHASLESLAKEARMRVRATAGAWYAALSGEARFGRPADGGNLGVGSFLDLEDNEASFAGDLALFIDDRWLVQLSAFDYATEATTTAPSGFRVNGAAFAAGTGLTSDLGLTSAAASAGYDFFGNVFEHFVPGGNENGRHVDIRAHLLASARGLNVDHRLAIDGGPTPVFDEWAATIGGGLRVGIAVGPDFAGRNRWDVDFVITYGVGGSSEADLTTLDLAFGIHYTVVDHFALVLGYRQIDFDFDAEDASQPYRYDGRLAGLFFGGEVKF